MGVHRFSYCPHCGTQIDYKVGYGHSDVGPAVANCPSCNQPYLTGDSEWKDKSYSEKFKYFILVPFRLIGSVVFFAGIGFFIMSGISYFIFDNNLSERVIYIGIGITALVGVFLWFKELRNDLAKND